MKKRALIAMSGGVDSSAAAALMQDAGYECIGVTMKLYGGEESTAAQGHTCCSLDDTEDARQVARRLGIPFYVFNYTEEFRTQVIDRFVAAYERGETPNPCIDCNRYMKFGLLYERARILSCDCIVTGHYARIRQDEASGRYLLLRGKNRAKDQSYVLCHMTQEQLSHTAFPLGEFESKEEIRRIAQERGFLNASKHDSQDICFVPDGDYSRFMERYTGKCWPEGDFVDEEGRVLGRHRGMIRYTIGQRKGLGLSLPSPLYVREKDMENNRVILSPESRLFRSVLIADDFNWISREEPAQGEEVRVSAKPRYRAPEAEACASVLEDHRVLIRFDAPQRALTAGQTVALYQGDIVVGGGTIREILPAPESD